MGKAKVGSKGKSKPDAPAKDAPARMPSARMVWPALLPRRPGLSGSSIDWRLPDQLGVVHDFFTPKECAALISACETQRFLPSPPARRGEASRSNERWSVEDPQFASALWAVLGPACAGWVGSEGRVRGLPATGLNSNIRVYRYSPGQSFGAHYDGSVADAVTGKKSEWTLLVYLTGFQDGVQGGETVFYLDHARRQDKAIVMPLERGAALLHRHGDACMLHEARPPTAGVKWVLRSDVTFG